MSNLIEPVGGKGYNSIQFDFPAIANGDRQVFAKYCDYFYNPTFTTIARFTGISNTEILCLLTESVFLYLWADRDLFTHYNSGYLFRTTLQVVTRYLKDRGGLQRAKAIEDMVRMERIYYSTEKRAQNDSTSK